MASNSIHCTELHINDIKLYAPKPTQGGGKNVGMINKNSHQALHISLPVMFTFGASDYEGNEKFSCSLQFPDTTDESVDPVYGECLTKLIEFEAALKRKVFEYAKDWLGKPMKSEDMVDMIWTPMLKYPKVSKDSTEVDTTRPPTFNVKIPCFEGKWSSEIYDEDKSLLFPSETDPAVTPLNFITKGTNMKTIVKCAGLWIVGGKMGITWKLVQALVRQQNVSRPGVCHIEMNESEKSVLKRKADLSNHQDPDNQEETTSSSSSSSAAVSTEVMDSDDEQEAGKEEGETPETEELDEEPRTPSAAPTVSPSTSVEPKGKKAKRDTKK
jgi:hypothetical protein